MGKINIMQSWGKKYVHLYTTLVLQRGFAKFGWQIRSDLSQRKWKKQLPNWSPTEIFVRPDADQTAIISHMYVQHTNLNPS